ncbi:hypothetical protein CCMA1212_008045 [Trichoderma ghanense]|uniref:Uncharacterized protein n=1 Tax=Trichoderma ghanense TaxID=65468 RepID=A0ABY2GWB5_9HYPO
MWFRGQKALIRNAAQRTALALALALVCDVVSLALGQVFGWVLDTSRYSGAPADGERLPRPSNWSTSHNSATMGTACETESRPASLRPRIGIVAASDTALSLEALTGAAARHAYPGSGLGTIAALCLDGRPTQRWAGRKKRAL